MQSSLLLQLLILLVVANGTAVVAKKLAIAHVYATAGLAETIFAAVIAAIALLAIAVDIHQNPRVIHKKP
jgi:hypothetical protein